MGIKSNIVSKFLPKSAYEKTIAGYKKQEEEQKKEQKKKNNEVELVKNIDEYVEDETEDDKENIDIADNSFKIAMLGTSGTGKTAFLAAVNYCMIQKAPHGFRLEMNRDVHFDQLYRSIEEISLCDPDGNATQFPPGTGDGNNIYKLNLWGENEKYIGFEFIDYKGAHAQDALNPTYSNHDVDEFKEFLRMSDVIFVFVDSVKLSQIEDAGTLKQECHLNVLLNFFTTVLTTNIKPYDVIFLLSKADDEFVKKEHKENYYEKLVEKAKLVFEPIKGVTNSCAFIPVSVVGEGGAITTQSRSETGRLVWNSELIRGKYLEPMHIEISILYACSKIMEKRIREEGNTIKELNQELRETRGRKMSDTLLGNIKKLERRRNFYLDRLDMLGRMGEQIGEMKYKYNESWFHYIYEWK